MYRKLLPIFFLATCMTPLYAAIDAKDSDTRMNQLVDQKGQDIRKKTAEELAEARQKFFDDANEEIAEAMKRPPKMHIKKYSQLAAYRGEGGAVDTLPKSNQPHKLNITRKSNKAVYLIAMSLGGLFLLVFSRKKSPQQKKSVRRGVQP